MLENLLITTLREFKVSYLIAHIPNHNWNEEWEKNFQPIVVAGHLRIRAVFHEPDLQVDHEIIIQPQMSFGTGHHATTYLMCEEIMNMNWDGKLVLDMGSGTGILAILAMRLGAKTVDAIDIDEWSVNNISENIELNNTKGISIFHNDINELKNSPRVFDVVLANINRNVLLADFAVYIQSLKPGGDLLLSGFYNDDSEMLLAKAGSEFALVSKILRDVWCMLHLRKLHSKSPT